MELSENGQPWQPVEPWLLKVPRTTKCDRWIKTHSNLPAFGWTTDFAEGSDGLQNVIDGSQPIQIFRPSAGLPTLHRAAVKLLRDQKPLTIDKWKVETRISELPCLCRPSKLAKKSVHWDRSRDVDGFVSILRKSKDGNSKNNLECEFSSVTLCFHFHSMIEMDLPNWELNGKFFSKNWEFYTPIIDR
jgi:hypothetical protein